MATANFISWASEPNTKKIIAVITSARLRDVANTVPLYLASHAGAWDGSHFFEELITGNLTVSTSSQITTHGFSKPTYGSLSIIVSTDFAEPTCAIRTSDFLSANKNVVLFGQPITAKIGGEDLAWADWHTIVTGYFGSPSGAALAYGGSKQIVSVPIYSATERLTSKQIPLRTYSAP